MAKPQNPVLMAIIGAPHGIRGEVRVKTFTGDPMALGEYGPLYAVDGRKFTLGQLRPAKTVVVARFKEIADRNAAEAATGLELFVDRSALPDDLDDDEFYQTDLIGLSVRDENDQPIGKVNAVHNFGGGDIVEVTLGGRRSVLIPFTLAAIPKVSIADGLIQIDSAAAGLLDDDDENAESSDVTPDDRPRGPKSAGGNR